MCVSASIIGICIYWHVLHVMVCIYTYRDVCVCIVNVICIVCIDRYLSALICINVYWHVRVRITSIDRYWSVHMCISMYYTY